MPAAPAQAVDCPATGTIACPGVTSTVLGYVFIDHQATVGAPLTYRLFGAVAAPTEWTCSDSTSTTGAYTVTCTPTPSNFVSWRCDVLHADASTSSSAARMRTILDCNGVAPAEAQTSAVGGTGGHDTQMALAAASVTAFSCTVDDGAGNAPVPDFAGGCGDPGLVDVEVR